jgi:uncharacterized protein
VHAEPPPAATVAVEVVWAAGPHALDVVSLVLPVGATVADALRASGLPARHGFEVSDTPGAAVLVACWGRPAAMGALLRDRDRLELLRQLTVDPKEARRLRYRRQEPRARSRGASSG